MTLLRLVASVLMALLDSWKQHKIIKAYKNEQKSVEQDTINSIPDDLSDELLDKYRRD